MGAAEGIMLLLGLLDRAVAWGAVVAKAQAEGRDITAAELDTLAAEDDAAKAALDAAIAKAKAEGR